MLKARHISTLALLLGGGLLAPAWAAPAAPAFASASASAASAPALAKATPARGLSSSSLLMAAAGPLDTASATRAGAATSAASPLGVWSPRQDAHTLDVGRAGQHRRKHDGALPPLDTTVAAAPAPAPTPASASIAERGVATPVRMVIQPASAAPSPLLTPIMRRYALARAPASRTVLTSATVATVVTVGRGFVSVRTAGCPKS